MSFFQKANPRKGLKRKFDPKFKKNKKPINVPKKEEENESDSVDSELEARDAPDRSDSEGELETPQEKKVRLARLYLAEVEREQRLRVEGGDADGDRDGVADRLRDEHLEQQGRLRKEVAHLVSPPTPADIVLLRTNRLRLSITCLCITSDGQFLFTGSKCASLIKWSLSDLTKLNSVVFNKKGLNKKKFKCHSTTIASLAVTTDSKYLVSCDQSNDIQVWDPATLQHLHTFKGHRDLVTDVVFRKESHQLFSASKDRTVKVWSLDEMAYIETVFGHQASLTAIDALSRERAITAGGRDTTLRIWKIVEESQLIYNGHSGSIDCVKLLNEENFVSGGDDGNVCIWGSMKKKPLCVINKAHGLENGLPRWITCVSAMLNSDIVASGSHDGFIRLWKLGNGCRSATPLLEIPVKGFVNSLVFTPDGSKLIAGVGQEHKLARWWTVKEAKNAVYIIPILKNR